MQREAHLTFEGGLSAGLLDLIARASENVEEVIRQAAQMIVESVPDYGLSSDPLMSQDLARSCEINLHLWFNALLLGKQVTPETLEEVVAFARRRVHQGISLQGLLRAYRVYQRAIWRHLMNAVSDDRDLQVELLFKISPYLLKHFDIVAEAIATTYLQEQSQHTRWRDRLRQELWTIVHSRPDDAQAFRQHSHSLGIASGQAHCAVALLLSSTAREQPERHIDAPLVMLGRRMSLQVDSLMRAIHRDHLIVWVPLPRDQGLVDFERALAAAAEVVVTNSASISAIGIGLPGQGAHGWRASMEQAMRAVIAAAASQRPPGAHRYSKIFMDEAMSMNPNIAEFMRATIELLAVDPALEETLHSYIEHQQHRKATAAALEVHPNTLDHRLGRIETLLDGSFGDIDWLARISAALRLYRPRRSL